MTDDLQRLPVRSSRPSPALAWITAWSSVNARVRVFTVSGSG